MRRLSLSFCGLLGVSAAWATPVQMQHSGRILAGDGAPIQGEVTLRVALWDALSGGTSAWSEDYTLTPDNGYYTLTLGADTAGNPMDHSLMSGGGQWLELSQIASNLTVTPLGGRQPLVSVPSSAFAQTASTAESAATADYATTAGTADSATSADTAMRADSADYATTAGTADSATSADTATSADSADYATTAGTADSATSADTATSADSADYATTAGTAD
ncbi:MAG: hypothetical protein ACJA00_004440, partial [Myxococcota bacterium]